MKHKYELSVKFNRKTIKAYFEKANGLRTSARKIKGIRKFTNIVLKRGYTTGSSLFKWASTKRNKQRKIRIALLNDSASAVKIWNVRAGWPSKWEGPGLNGKSSEVTIDQIVLTGDGIEVVSPDCKDC